jgi:hypothetical protein
MSENGLHKLFRINEIKILMSVTGRCPHQIFIFEIQIKGNKKKKG